jgi:alpha-amylase
MSNIFQDLKQKFQKISLPAKETKQNLGESTQNLQEWISGNLTNLINWGKSGEFNGTMFQWFHWYIPPDGNHWHRLQEEASKLAQVGITAVWLPPVCKGNAGGYDVGYGIYDLFDLGEFDQKGSIRTKYGTKDELLAAIREAKKQGLQIYADVVFNHKMGGDEPENVEAVPVSWDNRGQVVGDVRTIQAWTHFTFPGRGSQYSSMQWHWWHFDAVDHDGYNPSNHAIYRFKDKQFDSYVELEKGNYDYLMGCDLDMEQEEVQGELKYWGQWFIDTAAVDGFRFDALKHINAGFINEWLGHVKNHAQKELFALGEYWTPNLDTLSWYIGQSGGQMHLFDVPLHYNFSVASRSGNSYDMRKILDHSLMQNLPLFAVTFVANHDSQPLQALESVVEPWFKPLAYAIILLREQGYPCIFYADYYGANYRDRGSDGNEYEIWMNSHQWLIDRFLLARKYYAYGPQYDYFDHPNTIGWTRLGNEQHPRSMAVIMTNGSAGYKWMEVGKPNTVFYDITEHIKEPIKTNEHGWGEFPCQAGSVSVWLEKQTLIDQLADSLSNFGIKFSNK